jgi:hypothetical protein
MNETSAPHPADTSDLPKNGRPQMVTLSSTMTLFWRIFIPIFGTVFLSALLAPFLLIGEDDYYMSLPLWLLRLLSLLIPAAWIFFVYRTLWRLKRVDADATHFYATNYWTTVRYPWQDLERIEEKVRLGRRVVNFHLHSAGRFGQIISFLPGSYYHEWMSENKNKLPYAGV